MDLYNTPALHPPPGVESNFINPYTQQPTTIAVSVVCLAICVAAIAARSYVQWAILQSFNMPDYALILTGVLFSAFTALQIAAGEHGQGSHQWHVTMADFSQLLRLLNIIEILYGPTMFLAKYVVLQQIDTIFLNHHRQSPAFKAIRMLIWMNLLFYTAIMVSFILACIPREKIWHPDLEGRCIDTPSSIIATSAINVVSDLTILFVPIVGIWKLKLPLRRKLGAGAVFAVGIFANIASIIRLYYSVELTRTHDLTWAIEPVACWALAEFTTVILVACAPFFPRLFNHFSKKNQGSQPHSSLSSASKNSHRLKTLRSKGGGNSTTALRGPAGVDYFPGG